MNSSSETVSTVGNNFVSCPPSILQSHFCVQRLVFLLFRCHHFSTAIHLRACCQATPDTLGMWSECRSRCGICTLFLHRAPRGFHVVQTPHVQLPQVQIQCCIKKTAVTRPDSDSRVTLRSMLYNRLIHFLCTLNISFSIHPNTTGRKRGRV